MTEKSINAKSARLSRLYVLLWSPSRVRSGFSQNIVVLGRIRYFVEVSGIEPESESVYERESTTRSQRYL